MKRLSTIFCVVILIFSISPLSAGKWKVHIFPIASTKTETHLSMQYTDLLGKRLLKTEMFEIAGVENFSFSLKDDFGVFKKLRESVETVCEEKELDLVIFGYLRGFQARILFYSARDKSVISEYKEMLYGAKSLDISTKNCAMQFAVDLTDKNASRSTLISAAVPGLGHIMTKKYVRGFIYMGGFTYYLVKYLTAEKS